MGKVWVLDTETKGTGATVVPLEQTRAKPARRERPLFSRPLERAEPKPPEPPAPRRARRFKVVDVLSREVLAEDVDLRETFAVLRDQRRNVDVRVSVWDREHDDWRPLTLAEQRTVWDARERS